MFSSNQTDMIHKSTHQHRSRTRTGRLALVTLMIGVLAALIFSASSAATLHRLLDRNQSTSAGKADVKRPVVVTSKESFALLRPLAPMADDPDSVATFAANCTTPKTAFSLGETVCAVVSGGPSLTIVPRRLAFVDTIHFIRDVTDVTTDPQSISFTLPTSPTTVENDQTVDNRGVWRIDSVPGGRFSVRASAFFTVSDPANATANLVIYKSNSSDGHVTAGSDVTYGIWLANRGPDAAANVQITDAVPANTTFVSGEDTGSPLNCSYPSPGGGGTTTCTIASLAAGATARITIILNIDAGTAVGTEVTNTATISSATAEQDNQDNSESSSVTIISGAPSTCSLECPNDIVTTANATQGPDSGAFVTFSVDPTGTCGSITSNPASGSFFAVGTTTVTSSASGGGSCTFTVKVVGGAAPTISCPANITVTANSGESEAFVPDPSGSSSNPGTPTATGNGVTVLGLRSDNRNLDDSYPIGNTTINWTATDTDARTASCTQTITVISAEPLTITCPADVTVTAPSGSCEATVDPGTATATPGSSTVTSRRSDDLPLTDPYPAGVTTITWTATGTGGNKVSCIQTITVHATDTTPPTLNIPPDVNVTTSSCSALVDDELGVATADDNCTASVSISRTGVPTFSCPIPGDPGRQCESFVFPVGTTNVTYTATDSAGNSTVAVQHVTVHENTPPTITGPANVGPVFTGAGATSCGAIVSDATLGSATANDNCPGVTVTRTGVPAGNNFPVGTTTVTYTATDASGNTAVATQSVTVVDNTPPVVTAPGATSTDAGSCSATIPNVVVGSTASDNCGIASVTQSPAAGTAVGLGTHTITVTATDTHGNTSQATTTFTVNALQFQTKFWLGLKNSDDVGTKFDVLAEVSRNGTPVGSAQINDVPGGSSGFNNAVERTISSAISSVGFCTGDTLSLKLSVRVAASSGHVSGTARLWYNNATANSRFNKIVNGVTTSYYLRNVSNVLVLNTSTGPTQLTIDVLVNRNQNGNPFKPFGTWSITF